LADNLTPEQRIVAMRGVKSKNTSAEIAVRKLCRELGRSGYRLHRKDIPGKPDIAFIGLRAVIFVHGCFWHGHDCPAGTKKPKTNSAYWRAKIKRNKLRDAKHLAALDAASWHSLVVWECEIRQPENVKLRIARFLAAIVRT
jgi:DNA mismatch endonuclease (patch repair protein)